LSKAAYSVSAKPADQDGGFTLPTGKRSSFDRGDDQRNETKLMDEGRRGGGSPATGKKFNWDWARNQGAWESSFSATSEGESQAGWDEC